jgi:antitoxin ParD1/3/4
MPTRNVNLTEHFDQFIEGAVESGRFCNASEIVREGLRLLEQRDLEDRAKLEWLQSAALEAFSQLDRREGIRFSTVEDLASHIEKIREEVSAHRPEG